MNAQKIEPIFLLGAWLKELDITVAKSPEKPLISDIAQTIKSQFCTTLLQEYGLHLNLVRLRSAAVVIYQT